MRFVFNIQSLLIWNIALCVFLIFLYEDYQKLDYDAPSLYFLDVKNGDSIFIKLPSKHHILIDSGEGKHVLQAIEKCHSYFDKTIDLFVLSSPKPGYIDGAIDILKRYKVKRILWSAESNNSVMYKTFYEIAQREKIPFFVPKNTQDYMLGANSALDILFPIDQNIHSHDTKAMVFRFLHNQQSVVFFSGDATSDIEKEILTQGQDIRSEMLKVGNFGSNRTLSSSFLTNVAPRIGIISVGTNNPSGFPHTETLQKFQKNKVFLTKNKGTIVIQNKNGIWMQE